jgi:hypothetical protein
MERNDQWLERRCLNPAEAQLITETKPRLPKTA